MVRTLNMRSDLGSRNNTAPLPTSMTHSRPRRGFNKTQQSEGKVKGRREDVLTDVRREIGMNGMKGRWMDGRKDMMEGGREQGKMDGRKQGMKERGTEGS